MAAAAAAATTSSVFRFGTAPFGTRQPTLITAAQGRASVETHSIADKFSDATQRTDPLPSDDLVLYRKGAHVKVVDTLSDQFLHYASAAIRGALSQQQDGVWPRNTWRFVSPDEQARFDADEQSPAAMDAIRAGTRAPRAMVGFTVQCLALLHAVAHTGGLDQPPADASAVQHIVRLDRALRAWYTRMALVAKIVALRTQVQAIQAVMAASDARQHRAPPPPPPVQQQQQHHGAPASARSKRPTEATDLPPVRIDSDAASAIPLTEIDVDRIVRMARRVLMEEAETCGGVHPVASGDACGRLLKINSSAVVRNYPVALAAAAADLYARDVQYTRRCCLLVPLHVCSILRSAVTTADVRAVYPQLNVDVAAAVAATGAKHECCAVAAAIVRS